MKDALMTIELKDGRTIVLPAMNIQEPLTNACKESGQFMRSGTLSFDGLLLPEDTQLKTFFKPIPDSKADVEFDMNGITFSGTGFISSLTDTTPKRKATYKRFKRNGKQVLRINIAKQLHKSYSATLQIKGFNP